MTDMHLAIPEGLSPDQPLDRFLEQQLLDAGFLPGYPVFAIETFDELRVAHLVTWFFPHRVHPTLPVSLRVPDGSPGGQRRVIQMQVREISRVFASSGSFSRLYWFIRGFLESPEKGRRWYLGRIQVDDYELRACVADPRGYIQFIPKGSPKLGPMCDGLQWGSSSGRIPPPIAPN